jgi:elongation factor Ts
VVERRRLLGAYLHGTRIGAGRAIEGGDAALAQDLAMHVAASNPQYVSAADVPADVLAKEREIETEKALGTRASLPTSSPRWSRVACASP